MHAAIIGMNIIGIALCLIIALLSRNIYHCHSRNPLLLISGFLGWFGLVVLGLALYWRMQPGGEFPSSLVGTLIWGFSIFTLLVLAIVLAVNKWLPHWWRGRN